jgi:hypothetical protein
MKIVNFLVIIYLHIQNKKEILFIFFLKNKVKTVKCLSKKVFFDIIL